MINYSISGIVQKLRQRSEAGDTTEGTNPVQENMRFINPLIVPRHFNALIDELNKNLLRKSIRSNIPKSIGYFTYVNGATLRLMKDFKLSILDLAQRRQVSSELSDDLKATEREAVKAADIVLADNRATIADYHGVRKDIHYLPQGVNLVDFVPGQVHPQLMEKRKTYKKVIGYIGTDMVFDYDLLKYLITKFPQHLFVFVGQLSRPRSHELLELPNVWHAGRVAHKELAPYLKGFDLGLIPYRIDEFTKGVFPTKAFEYLAAGVPVLSTALPELKPYESEGLQLANSPEQSFILINEMLASNLSGKGLVQSVANESWDARFEVLKDLIEDQLKNPNFEA